MNPVFWNPVANSLKILVRATNHRHQVPQCEPDAESEQLETQHWTDIAFDCGYLTQEQQNFMLAQLSEIGKMLHSMIAKANQFCGTLDH